MPAAFTALPLLIEQAREARDRLAASAQQATMALRQAEQTLQQLAGFREDYLRRSPVTAGRGLHADALGDFQRFITRLDEAVATQREECERRRQFDAMRQRQLVDGQRRLMAFEALAARQANARALKQHRQAQRESDEFAARALRINTLPETT